MKVISMWQMGESPLVRISELMFEVDIYPLNAAVNQKGKRKKRNYTTECDWQTPNIAIEMYILDLSVGDSQSEEMIKYLFRHFAPLSHWAIIKWMQQEMSGQR